MSQTRGMLSFIEAISCGSWICFQVFIVSILSDLAKQQQVWSLQTADYVLAQCRLHDELHLPNWKI